MFQTQRCFIYYSNQGWQRIVIVEKGTEQRERENFKDEEKKNTHNNNREQMDVDSSQFKLNIMYPM